MLSNVRNKNRIFSLLLLIIMLETQAKIVKEKNGSKIGKTVAFLDHLRESTKNSRTNKRT